MKLSCGKRQSSVSAPIVCHRISVHNLTCCTRGPNERALIPLIWPSQNLLIVPYCIVPLLISLVLCVILSSENTSFFGDSLNCNRNEYLIKCTSLRPSVFFSLFTLKLLLNSVLHQGKGHKLASSVFVPFTLTTTLLLLTANSHSARAQMAFLNPDPMDSYEHEDEEDNEQTAYPTIKALVNGSVGLPCNISHTKEENSIKLILWYKNNVLGTPIYSIDARDTNISQARHFVAPPYRGRASFELNLASRLALLVVKPLLPGDDGHYICRVDFRWTRTTISNVKLDVIVPPQQLRVIQLHQWSIPMATTTGTSTITTNSSGVGSFAAKLPGSVATRQWDNGSEMHWRQQQHPAYLQTSVLSILHNGSMINEIETVRQPEETELTMYCDSIGARPRSMVKWYRLDQLESSQANSTARQLYSALHSTDEKALQLIDDSFHQVNQTELQSNPLATSNTHYNAVPIEAPVTNGEVSHAEMVRNELHLGIVQDTNHGQLYLCRTSNSNLSKPLDAIVRLEIYTRPKSIQIRQQMPSKDLLPPPNPSSASSSWSELQLGKSHPEDGHHFRNRTLHSISLLDYYLNANQPLMMQPLRLRSGFESELLCQSNGSRPAAKIVWLLRDYRTNVEKDITQLSSSYFNGHDTLSLLRFVPKFTDNRASIICRASNEALRQASAIQPTANNNTSPRNGHRSDHYADANKSQMTLLTSNLPFQLETSILLDVNYKPIVSMAILSGEQMYREVAQSKGRKEETKGKVPTIQPEPLQPKPECHRFVEMQEIFFNCSINANPQVHLVHWFFNGKALHTDLNKGLIITNSNRTMIVSSASKANAGYFHCSATNLLGETNSDRHQIDILYEPQCRVDYMQTWYHQLGDVVQLKCQVLANPVDNLQFDWQFNGTALVGHSEAQWLDANRSSVIDHTTVPIEEDNLVASEDRAKASRLAVSNDKSRRKANLPHSTRSTTHSSSQQQHLITNVVRIELRTWTSFGHFSCQASNQVGPQKEACKWHIVPHHYHLHHQDGSGEHLSGSQKESSQQKHQHRYHHRHHQQQSPSGQHHPHFANLASTLNNCQIIESSNAVVIKCLDATDQASESISQDFLAQIGNDAHQQPNPSTIDRVASAASPSISGELARETFTNSLNSTLQDKTDWNSKLPDTNGAEQHYFPQIDQPEPGKRVASKASTSSLPSAVTESALVMDTINFTNPLFIITNLSASTSYLLKIWSSKAHLGSVVEQVNITVRTRANDDNHGPYSTDQVRPDSMSATLATLLKMGSQKLVLLVALVALICILFVALTLTYAIFKIRAILDMRKGMQFHSNLIYPSIIVARRAVNVNESISALETALCEMRPEHLENDLKSKSHFSMDTYRPYISVDNVTEDCVFMGEKAPSCTSTVKRQFADSSVITYPNYLYPSMTTGTVTHKSGLKLNCSDEESISTSNTSASNRSMLTNTTESTNANSNYATDCTKDRLELHFDKRCFAPPVTLESGPNLLFCMESDLAPSRSSHAFLVPEPYHSYPLQLHILPESNEDLECNLTQSVTMVSTPSADQCAYLPSMDTQNATITTVVDFPLPLATGTLGSEPETNGQKSIQTAV